MKVGVVRESVAGENRVALIPEFVPALIKQSCSVIVQAGAGQAAGYEDLAYVDKGASVGSRAEVLQCDVLLCVRIPGFDGDLSELSSLPKKQIVIGFANPLVQLSLMRAYASNHQVLLAMELIPRISRAQSMDALSSMASISGYKAVLLAAVELSKIFPMMMTAAGSNQPARVFVIGAGVAGLQAIATAHRLGALVRGYDIRPEVKDQVESVGAKFVELPLTVDEASDAGGYARAMDEAFYQRQRELLAQEIEKADVVITTAAVPGKKAPILVTKKMIETMRPGSVVVDLAAEMGGNCEGTQADVVARIGQVVVLGPTNLPATVPQYASKMYAKNVTTLLLHVLKEGKIAFSEDDPIVKEARVTMDGLVTNQRVAQLVGALE